MSANAEAVKEELQQMAQQAPSGEAPSSDDSNDQQDFWSSLGETLDAEDRGEETPAEPQTGEEAQSQAPPAEPNQEASAQEEEEQPPQPAQQEAQPEPEEEEAQPGIDPEQAKLAAEKWQKDLETYFTEQLGDQEEFQSDFLQNPQKHLPKLMAQAVQVTMKNAYAMLQQQMPQLEQKMIQNSQGVIDATIAKRAFYKKHPGLKAHEKEFDKFFQRYRSISDPNTPVDQQATEAAQVFMMRKGIKPQQPAASTTPPSSAPPPPPVTSGATPNAPKQSDNPWQAYADELAAQDDDF
jgi:hypothetical protein